MVQDLGTSVYALSIKGSNQGYLTPITYVGNCFCKGEVPKLHTLNSKPEDLSPKPQNLNPKP